MHALAGCLFSEIAFGNPSSNARFPEPSLLLVLHLQPPSVRDHFVMATYREIKALVRLTHGFDPQSCWIAHVKEISGLPVKRSPKRPGPRLHPCPIAAQTPIKDALKYFGMI
jgi:hypothetical protein